MGDGMSDSCFCQNGRDPECPRHGDRAQQARRASAEALKHRDPVLVDGMPCTYCSQGCETRGLPEPTIKDNHVVCFCPCHRLAEVLAKASTPVVYEGVELMTHDELRKCEAARFMLEPPAPEVVGRLLATINKLREENSALEVERDDLTAQRDAFGQKAQHLQEKLRTGFETTLAELRHPELLAAFAKLEHGVIRTLGEFRTALGNPPAHLTREPAPIDSGKKEATGSYPCSKCTGHHFTGECPNS